MLKTVMAKRTDQAEHQQLIERVARYLISNGYKKVKADYSGFDIPNEINWKGDQKKYVPDLSAEKKKRYVFEVETEDSIDDDHTQTQWRVFAAFAYQNNGNFIVVVPSGSGDKAKKRLNDLNLPGKVLEI